METTEKLLRVTPQELSAVFDRLEAEGVTRLAIVGPNLFHLANSNPWPNYVQFELSEQWPALVDRVIRLRHLDGLVLFSFDLGDDRARAIAEHLTQLTSLNVGYNQIGDAGTRAIAESLTDLQELWLNNNSVGQPTIDVLGQRLRRLTKLSIASNMDIRDIGPLADLPALRYLNVANTSVSDLGPFAERIADGWPVRWERYGWVRYGIDEGLIVEDCPLVRPTVEIARQGPEAVRNYFRELAAQGEDFLYEAKVLILGEGGSGKTSLLRACISPISNFPGKTRRPAASTSTGRTSSATMVGRFGSMCGTSAVSRFITLLTSSS